MRVSVKWSLVAVVMSVISACASAPTGPYWEDPAWTQTLEDAIHGQVKYPAVFSADALPTGEGVAGFDYQNGQLVNVIVVRSTGYKKLDDAIVAGIQKATPPAVGRNYRSTVHHFEVPILMQPDLDQFRLSLYDAIIANLKLPKEVIPNTPVVLSIKSAYLNGALTNINMQKTSYLERLNNAVLDRLKNASLPPPPSNFKDKSIDIDMHLCVSLDYQTCRRDVGNQWMGFGGLSFVITPEQQ